MSHIEQSLRGLMGAIERLDHAVGYFEKSQNGKQRDMFAAPPAPVPQQPAQAQSINNPAQDALLARRLDVAISRVEELLGEEA